MNFKLLENYSKKLRSNCFFAYFLASLFSASF